MQNADSLPTLLHRSHLSLSHPDLTTCSSDLINSCSVKVLDDIGSDHRPILTTICRSTFKESSPRTTRWNFKKANWIGYKGTSDLLLSNVNALDIETYNEDLTNAILKAATTHIPRGCRKNYKPFWTEELKVCVDERRKARNELEKTPSIQKHTQHTKYNIIKLAPKSNY